MAYHLIANRKRAIIRQHRAVEMKKAEFSLIKHDALFQRQTNSAREDDQVLTYFTESIE